MKFNKQIYTLFDPPLDSILNLRELKFSTSSSAMAFVRPMCAPEPLIAAPALIHHLPFNDHRPMDHAMSLKPFFVPKGSTLN